MTKVLSQLSSILRKLPLRCPTCPVLDTYSTYIDFFISKLNLLIFSKIVLYLQNRLWL